jgi:hypothetical protein
MLISPPDVAIDHLFPPYSPEKNGGQATCGRVCLLSWFHAGLAVKGFAQAASITPASMARGLRSIGE